jgi:hypothetical protein
VAGDGEVFHLSVGDLDSGGVLAQGKIKITVGGILSL